MEADLWQPWDFGPVIRQIFTSIDMKIEPFAEFIAERVRWSIKQAAAKARS
jgi:hypothetical protein